MKRSTTWLILPLLQFFAACTKENVYEQNVNGPEIRNEGPVADPHGRTGAADPNGSPLHKPSDEGSGPGPHGRFSNSGISTYISPGTNDDNSVWRYQAVPGSNTDAGSAMDPNGKPAAASPGDRGYGLDPNGKAIRADEGGIIDPYGRRIVQPAMRDVGPRMDDNGRTRNNSAKDEGGWVDPNG